MTLPALSAPPVLDNRRAARGLYWQGWRVTDIAAHLGEKRPTVEAWKQRDKWDETKPIERVEHALEARMCQLIAKEHLSGHDMKTLDLLGRQVERLARVRRFNQPGGHAGDLNDKVLSRNMKASAHRPTRNHFTEEQEAKLFALFEESLFDYQKFWAAAGIQRTRVILKSRQIGATWYYAREALVDALKTKRNQIFLSASKAQAHVFRQYIVAFAKEVGVDLTGDPIVLSNGAILYFLGTNARTAQGYHGNFYFDEFFWTHRFQDLNKVASGMAMHKKWRKTYFSTPSSVTHEAYAFWTGELWNRRRPKGDRQAIDTSHAALAHGAVGADRIWRQIVTVMDAAAGGCDLFDIDELKLEYSPDQFDNLLMCGFIDDTLSSFPLAFMQVCRVDAWEEWDDFRPLQARPFGNKPVWVGFDPSDTGDTAALVVIAPPASGGGRFRVLEKQQFRGLEFEAQARAIEAVTKRYNVEYIGIDTNGGYGKAVMQLVLKFFPLAKGIDYSPEMKQLLVLKAQNVIRHGRLQYDAGWNDVTQSFMQIRKTLTASGKSVTYEASRSEETGHADLAWAIMHVTINEPLDASIEATVSGSSFLEIH